MTILTLTSPIKAELKEVRQSLSQLMKETSTKVSSPMIEHLLASPGKQVRSMLVILIYKLFSVSTDNESNLIKLASSIELVHLASLVHDDVIDRAEIRRNQASINQKWGNEIAVALGVSLYSLSLSLIAEVGDLNCLRSISKAVKLMCDGELYQLSERGKDKITLDKYYKIIHCKTAALFESACECGAYLSGGRESDLKWSREFGKKLGDLFQLTDDYLDFFGDGKSLKKTVGQDIAEGQVTLPLILLRDQLKGDDYRQLVMIIEGDNDVDNDWVMKKMLEHNIESELKIRLESCYEELGILLNKLPSSAYLNSISKIANAVYGRI